MTYANWSAWRLDHLTWGWILWVLFFVVWETYALKWHPGEELTAHLRPLFLSAPVIWWFTLGLWLWVGIHLLAPAWEASLLRTLSSKA